MTEDEVLEYFDKHKPLDIVEDEKIGSEWQSECLERIKDSNNVILASPTGSGKTSVFLQWALQKVQRPIYITSPIKALSNQRWRELQEQGFVVGLETGDIKNVPENCDFICCTQEIYTNKYIEIEDATLIMDEFHYIFEDHRRSRTYIDALHNSKAKNILLCSATMGDIDELDKYIENVSNRKFTTYKGTTRLTHLEYHGEISIKNIENAFVVAFSKRNIKGILDALFCNREPLNEDKLAQLEELYIKYNIDNYGNKLLDCVKHGIVGYHGGLLPKEKLFVEECFEKRIIDTVVGTDALAMGVNFPIENVVFAQLAKEEGPISKNLFEQIAGRAGRKGYFDRGNVYFCDEFRDVLGYPLEHRDYDIKLLYVNLLLAKNENATVYLRPHIKGILQGSTTVEEEAEFIARFSTDRPDLDGEITKINEIIAKIMDEYFYKQRIEYMLDYEFGYNDYDEEHKKVHIFKSDSEEVCEKRAQLLALKDEFFENIPDVYSEEYSAKKNCKIFIDILDGKDITQLEEKYTKDFNDLLQFRKYLKALPRKYRRNIDITQLEEELNRIDYTALNYGRGNLTVKDIGENIQEELLSSDDLKDALKYLEEDLGISELYSDKRDEIQEE